MANSVDFERFKEEQQVLDQWRSFARQAVANFLECCQVCDRVREKSQLSRCPFCDDLYFCGDGPCCDQHRLQAHHEVAEWPLKSKARRVVSRPKSRDDK